MMTPSRNVNWFFDITGKVALVTGGAAGIGRAGALALAGAGADVVIADLNEEFGKATAAAVNQIGRTAHFLRCNVTEEEQVAAVVDGVGERFGRLDIALNSGGIYRDGRDELQSKRDWDQVIAVNLTGTLLCAVAQARQMAKQNPIEGKII